MSSVPMMSRTFTAPFIAAGSQLILTNSFGGTAHRLRLHESQDRVGELNLAAAQLARRGGCRARGFGETVLVAGSMGPTGELFAPMGALDYADARAAFTAQARHLPKAVPTCCGSRRCRRWKRFRPPLTQAFLRADRRCLHDLRYRRANHDGGASRGFRARVGRFRCQPCRCELRVSARPNCCIRCVTCCRPRTCR